MSRLVPLALLLALGLFTTAAQAQEPAPEGGDLHPGSGPVPGYVATGMISGIAILVLCKSARR